MRMSSTGRFLLATAHSRKWGLCQLRLNAIQVETLAISSAISAVATYVGHGTRGPGSTTSENHIMCELWAPILSNAVKLAPNRLCLPLWECDYMFPQNAGLGSSRSDFVAMTIATDEEPLPFLITEFEANGVRVHKDYLVAVSEATLQLNSIVSRFCCGPEDLSKVRCFVALASDSSISFRVISPEVDNQAGGRIFYRETDCGRTFRLAQHDLSARIVDAVLLGIFNRCWDTSVDVAAWHEHSF
ncbi:hypothetical protein DFS34DRAFT_335185 [Phlyctochytrium arcticum]|nr:hypothetical protein DFS34DRAFT_335185 [Phlyctochytrium arcticum]